jgi:hypothetical protein
MHGHLNIKSRLFLKANYVSRAKNSSHYISCSKFNRSHVVYKAKKKLSRDFSGLYDSHPKILSDMRF